MTFKTRKVGLDWYEFLCFESASVKLGLDTNNPKNALKIYLEILNFFPKNPSKNF